MIVIYYIYKYNNYDDINITDFEEIVRLDQQYIANWNIWLDIRILAKTVDVVIRRKGAK